MRTHLFIAVFAFLAEEVWSEAVVYHADQDVTYTGVSFDGIETFYSIPYGQDTGGANRFKNPVAYVPDAGTAFDATQPGPKCPQSQKTADSFIPLYLSNVTEYSEDCLHVNVYRAVGTASDANLPVMLYIHGGSFIIGSKDELVTQPGGLILQSVDIGQPVISVNINYRLGVFGFAQSEALTAEGSTNMGLRDQRLAIEWARDNIAYFGGDPSRIEILGQSSGGLAMGMQMLAYGGDQGFSFIKVSAESQILEGGITGDFTKKAMQRIVKPAKCNNTDPESADAIACLRALSTKDLLQAQTSTHHDGPGANVGDEWLPMVDGDFLPDAPSALIAAGRFAKVPVLSGWCEDDTNPFVGTPKTEKDVHEWFTAYLPGFTSDNVDKLLSLYPSSDFSANPSAGLTAQFYRAGRILRDILMVCQPIGFGKYIAANGQPIYFWDQNQTMLDEILDYLGAPGYGVVHTSNFAYQFANLSHYNVDNFPYNPNASDFALAQRQSHSWISFANTAVPTEAGVNSLSGWSTGFASNSSSNSSDVNIYVIGGPEEGLSAWSGSSAPNQALVDQKLKERCGFLNQPDVIEQLLY